MMKDASGKLMAMAQSISGHLRRGRGDEGCEEVAMAEWLKENLAPTTQQFLARAEADSDSAKR